MRRRAGRYLEVVAAGCVFCVWSGCSKAPCGPESEGAREEAAGAPAKAHEDASAPAPRVGVEDFVEYATGKAQIETMVRTKAKLEEVRAEHEKRLEEALDE